MQNIYDKRISIILAIFLFMMILVTGCSNSSETKNEEMGEASKKNAESTLDADHPKIEIEMEDGGKMVLELYPEYAPETVANFTSLTESGFYDGLTFHRIIKNFMIQGGDPEGNGTGGSDKNIKGEFENNGFSQNTLKHTKGVISMARSNDMDSASSQFFIMHGDVPQLDGSYAAFGKLIEGEEVLDEIANTPVKKNPFSGEVSVPENDIVIKKITVLK